jgi:hypothetical protein
VVAEIVEKSASAARWLLQLVDIQPKLGKVLADCYGVGLLKSAMESAKRPAPPRRVKQASRKRTLPDVTIYADADRLPLMVTEKIAETVKRDGIYVDDKRTETSKLYRVSAPLALQNPDCTGIYDVLCAPDDFARCFVTTDAIGRGGRLSSAICVKLTDSDNKSWSSAHPSEMFVVESYVDDEYDKWFEGLPEADSLQKGGLYMLVTARGDTTGLFEVENTEPAGEGETCYRVWFRSYDHTRPAHLPRLSTRADEEGHTHDVEIVSIGKIKGNSPLIQGNTLYMPPGTKKLQVRKPRDDEPTCCPVTSDTSDPPALRLASPVDLQVGIYKASAALKLFNDGCEANINGTPMSLKAGLIALVREHGLTEKAARAALGIALRKHGETFRIKYAQPYPLQQATFSPDMSTPEPGADPVMGSPVPTMQPYEVDNQISGLESATGSPDMAAPPSSQMAQTVMQAAQTGQQEVMDASILGNMMDATRDDTLIDQYLPAMVKCLDALGRLLFNRYQHAERFEERFGSDLSQIEDALRNTFENLGDITLKLKQRAIEPYVNEGYDVDLEPDTKS